MSKKKIYATADEERNDLIKQLNNVKNVRRSKSELLKKQYDSLALSEIILKKKEIQTLRKTIESIRKKIDSLQPTLF